MKLFIYGMDLILDECPIEECKNIINYHIPAALQSAPPGSIVLLIWYEYALIDNAISHKTMKECIQILQNGLAAYDNVILIPGSFSILKPYKDNPAKLQSIKQVYNQKVQNPVHQQDELFLDELHNMKAQEKRILQENIDGDYLRNKAYVLSGCGIFSQKKVDPFLEYLRLMNFDERFVFKDTAKMKYAGESLLFGAIPPYNWIFDCGIEKKTQKISVQAETLDIRLLICRDHNFDNIIQSAEKLPLIEVIVSNNTELDSQNLWGAVTIHMDSLTGLSVYINDLHPRRACIDEISAAIRHNLITKPVPVQSIDRDLTMLEISNNPKN